MAGVGRHLLGIMRAESWKMTFSSLCWGEEVSERKLQGEDLLGKNTGHVDAGQEG